MASVVEIWRHRPTHRVEYAFARALENAASTLPEGAAEAFGRNLGRTAHAIGIRRRLAQENLRLAFPDRDARWVEETARKAFEHLGREAAATLRLSKLDPRAIVDRTIPVGWDEFQEALSLGRGVLLVSGHYGNWEIGAATIASRGVPIAAIVRMQQNLLVDGRLRELRRKLGVETIYQAEARSRVPQILRNNGVIGIVGDQNARRAGVIVPFFGRPASTHRGAALFAIRFGAAVFSSIARRLPGNKPRYEVALRRVEVPRTGDVDADVFALTAELALRLEQQVRIQPEQYFWFHNRWRLPKSIKAAIAVESND